MLEKRRTLWRGCSTYMLEEVNRSFLDLKQILALAGGCPAVKGSSIHSKHATMPRVRRLAAHSEVLPQVFVVLMSLGRSTSCLAGPR